MHHATENKRVRERKGAKLLGRYLRWFIYLNCMWEVCLTCSCTGALSVCVCELQHSKYMCSIATFTQSGIEKKLFHIYKCNWVLFLALVFPSFFVIQPDLCCKITSYGETRIIVIKGKLHCPFIDSFCHLLFFNILMSKIQIFVSFCYSRHFFFKAYHYTKQSRVYCCFSQFTNVFVKFHKINCHFINIS